MRVADDAECDGKNMESGIATGQRYDDVGRVADACPSGRGHAPWDMPPLNLTQLAVGERVQHELLVVERLDKTQGHGDPCVLLTLGNASGSISVAPIWSSHVRGPTARIAAAWSRRSVR